MTFTTEEMELMHTLIDDYIKLHPDCSTGRIVKKKFQVLGCDSMKEILIKGLYE